MKFVSWNVNGLRACLGKGFLESFSALDADVFCLQETKMQPDQAQLDLPDYQMFWNSAEKKGYSGTAVFTRVAPLSVTYDIDDPAHVGEGRSITLNFPTIFWLQYILQILRMACGALTTAHYGKRHFVLIY